MCARNARPWLMPSARQHSSGFPTQHRALAGQSPVVAAQIAGAAEHAVAGHYERDRILADRGADGAGRARPAEFCGNVRISGGAAERNRLLPCRQQFRAGCIGVFVMAPLAVLTCQPSAPALARPAVRLLSVVLCRPLGYCEGVRRQEIEIVEIDQAGQGEEAAIEPDDRDRPAELHQHDQFDRLRVSVPPPDGRGRPRFGACRMRALCAASPEW